MYVVKRTKSAPPGNEPPAPPAVHYATSAAPAGNVTGWAADRSRARGFGEDEAAKIKAFYAGRENAGSVEAQPAESPRAGLVELSKSERKRGRKGGESAEATGGVTPDGR